MALDIARLETPPTGRPKGKSVMDVWLDTRTPDEQKAILRAAADPRWGHVALLNELQRDAENPAPQMSDTSFRQWRLKQGFEA